MTRPLLPKLMTEGDSVEDALLHVQDAFRAVELYEDLGTARPVSLLLLLHYRLTATICKL